jgi:hypothetical protein
VPPVSTREVSGMRHAHFEHAKAERPDLRAIVAAVDREVAQLPGDATSALRRSWTELVALLALGPPPELRQCPVCGHVGMRAATLCGYCWTRLSPLPDV